MRSIPIGGNGNAKPLTIIYAELGKPCGSFAASSSLIPDMLSTFFAHDAAGHSGLAIELAMLNLNSGSGWHHGQRMLHHYPRDFLGYQTDGYDSAHSSTAAPAYRGMQ